VVTVRLVPLSVSVMTSLLAGDLDGANAQADAQLTSHFVESDARGLWRYRLDQIHRDPTSADWIARAAVDVDSGLVVGHAGFHGPPDESGMVEIGYSVDVAYRHQGYATAMVRELLRRARDEPQVRVVRASISPDNAPSLAIVRRLGFSAAGEQWDEEDGLELVFEVPAEAPIEA
jgi:ribosomal-protein-alanine N-acetyltransferase